MKCEGRAPPTPTCRRSFINSHHLTWVTGKEYVVLYYKCTLRSHTRTSASEHCDTDYCKQRAMTCTLIFFKFTLAVTQAQERSCKRTSWVSGHHPLANQGYFPYHQTRLISLSPTTVTSPFTNHGYFPFPTQAHKVQFERHLNPLYANRLTAYWFLNHL